MASDLQKDGPEHLPPAYEQASAKPGYRSLVSSGVVIEGVYDDHDIGRNDAGRSLEYREESKQAFLTFLGVPTDSPRRSRHGSYSCHTFGEGKRSVKIISLNSLSPLP